MAETKGINIPFRGDTTNFDKAVKTINGEIKQTKSEISLLNKQLRFDPKNVEALTKKFELLRQKEKELDELTKTLQVGLKNLDPNSPEWAKYNTQLQKATVELQSIRKELSTLPTANVQILANNFKEWGEKLDSIGGKLESIGKKLSILSAGIVGLGTAGLKFNAQLEQYETAFTTLIGDSEKARDTISAIQKDASLSPFSTEALIEANQYLISANVEADDARQTILALGNAISATGGGSNELTRMAQNLQQIKNLGKASSVDIKQFANAGINIYGLLADTTGKTVEQIKKMDISYEVLNEALQKASREGGKYFGAMEAQSQTINGSLSTLRDTINQLLGELTQSLVPIVKEVIQFVNELITKIREMSPEQKDMMVRIAGIVAMLGPALSVIGRLIKTFGGLSTAVSNILKNEKIIALFAKLTAQGTSLGGVLKSIWTIIQGFINPFTVILGILAVLYATNEDIRNQINTLVQSMIGLLQPTIQLIINIVKIAWELFKQVVNILKKMWEQFRESESGKLFIQIIQQIIGWVQQAIDWISNLIGWLVKATDWFLKLLGVASDFNSTSETSRGKLNGQGFDVINSGGYASGGVITLNASFNVNSNNIGRSDVRQWASWLADDINEELGRRIR